MSPLIAKSVDNAFLKLSIFDPNTLLPHRAGIAGLALALSAINPSSAPLKWTVTEDEVSLSWEVSDAEAIKWLISQTYRCENGYLDVPSLNLDDQGRYVFSQGVTSSFLQHNKQRTFQKPAVSLSFLVEDGQPEIQVSHLPLVSCYYTGDFNGVFNANGTFNLEIPVKSHHLPGLVQCFVTNKYYSESPTGFLALLFLPLACSYYKLPGNRLSLVIPEVLNLKRWVALRRKMPGRTYRSFKSSSAGESALHFLLQERLAEDFEQFGVDYCEVYQLGAQPWNPKQNVKQAVHRVHVSSEVLGLYAIASQLLPSRVKTNQKGDGVWLLESKVLGWISDNLIANKAWYSGFFEFRKLNNIYPEDRKGLVAMAEYLTPEERVFFDSVQGAFRKYRGQQIDQAKRQGRPPDWEQMTDKVIYRLQRPSTQQEFSKAVVDFLSQFRSKEALSNGHQLFWWLNKEGNWRKARDLALLAIATYQGKSQEEKIEADQLEASTKQTVNVF